jgi:nicotinamidase/pyrazinamidase
MRLVTPPADLPAAGGAPVVFLAGSIEQDRAPRWQDRVVDALAVCDGVLLNPRRPQWDASWRQDLDDPRFAGQVAWELDGLERADVIACWFAAETIAPVTLLECGLHARGGRLVVGCPRAYHRRGNVEGRGGLPPTRRAVRRVARGARGAGPCAAGRRYAAPPAEAIGARRTAMECLILVDLQNDFCPGGALAVPAGDEVVAVANRLMPSFAAVCATQDWHPADHGSFAVNHPGRKPFELGELGGMPQVLWPAHCVQGTPGAEFHPQLDRARIAQVVRKGTDPLIDSYSGFFDNHRRKATGLEAWLRGRGVDAVVVCGLATDYCVKATALDAVALGWPTTVVTDACRGVGLKPDDIPAALAELERAGVRLATSAELLQAERTRR